MGLTLACVVCSNYGVIRVRTELSAQSAGAWKVAELNGGMGEIPKHFIPFRGINGRAGGMAQVVSPC